jgi:putative transposase
MKKPRFTDNQTLSILKQAESGTPVTDLHREHSISSALFYRWRSQYRTYPDRIYSDAERV